MGKKKGQGASLQVLREWGVAHCGISPRACTWQSDVEVFHKLIEEEFYDLEDYRGGEEFLAKSYAYALYFNF